jgi:predicted nucleotide-binding protein (sugar kinase/HSP70/actin superfamily)
MAYAGARMMAAAFQSIGIDASVTPDSNTETLELGGLHSSGEECLPHKVTLGDFLKVCRAPGFDPHKTAFFMPTAHGPCRFGQYAPYLRHQLAEMGHADVMVISPSSDNGYDGIGQHARQLVRTAWMGVICGDIATKFLLKTRPYETRAGDADAEFERSVQAFARVLAKPGITHRQRISELTDVIVQTRDRFRAIPATYVKGRPLIGLVGEIFCRLNTFSNDDVARRIEKHGGECWLSDIAEWVWYTNWCQHAGIVRLQGRLNADFVKLKLKTFVQRRYEHVLLSPVIEDFEGYEEPRDVEEVLAESESYLPSQGCLGEMVLSVGKAIYLYGKGADGIIDISPFTCMNGIICEAIYPSVSAEHDDLPIRICYFDGVNTNIDRDLEIFLDLARAYQKRKRHPRVYPDCFKR